MDPEIEKRLVKSEKTLEEHLANAYTYIDELRASHLEHAERVRMLEENQEKLNNGLLRLIEIQNQTAAILASMNGKLSDHDKRLTNGGL